MVFQEFNLSNPILTALNELGYKQPTPIQEQVIPSVLDGEDIVGLAQTGTGKTGAFAIPISHYLHRTIGSSKRFKTLRTLVLSPTRELAIQIGDTFEKVIQYTHLKQVTIFGGVNQVPQVDQLKRGADILVATPGRLLDLHKQGFIDLNGLHHLVIDEADMMLDMGFINDVKKIIALSPSNRQTLLFSATMPLPIREMTEQFLTHPKWVQADSPNSVTHQVKHVLYEIEKSEKKNLLYHVIRNEKLSEVLVFARTKHGADNIAKSLVKKGVKADAFHGDKSQSARQRILNSFKDKEIQVLVATDVAARGIDIVNLPTVINFDLPNIPETFVHRIGRTGRNGSTGVALSFCGKDEAGYWKDIVRLTQIEYKQIEDHPWPWAETSALTSSGEPKKVDRRKGFSAKGGSAKSSGKSEEKNATNNRSSSSRKSDGSKKNKKRWY